jgi:hypothetical protein
VSLASISIYGTSIPEAAEPTGIGVVQLPAILCGEHSNQNDDDTWQFQGDPTGEWTFSIVTPSGDRDVALLDLSGTELVRSDEALDPESFTYTLLAVEYRILTQQVDSGSGDTYQIVISK